MATMEDLEIGMRFPTYEILIDCLNAFCKQTKSKFWKRDARTISASRSNGVNRYLNPEMVYYEIRFSCVYGGMDFKSKARKIRCRAPSLKIGGCPAYLRFKSSADGECLQLVAKNLNHNHELKIPRTKKRYFRRISEKRERRRIENLDNDKDEEYELFENDNIEMKIENSMCLTEQKQMEMVSFNYRGLIAPVFTPFNDDLTLNLDVLSAYAEHLLNSGITGILVNGTTGEGTSMNTEERKLVTEAWAQVCTQTQQHLMVQIGGACLPDVIELAHHAEEKGANSLLCLPELYHKPTSSNDLIDFLKVVSEAAPTIPLLYYHIPSLTNVNIHMGKFLSEVQNQIPTFSGIKFTSTCLDEGMAAVKVDNKKYAVFLGADTIMAGAYTLGFDSAIATTLNIFPALGMQIQQGIQVGNVPEAQNCQNQLNTAINVITKNGSWVSTMKTAMNLITSIDLGPVRQPLKSLTEKQIEQMKSELTAMQLSN